jgi:hypothetical protein
MRITRAGAITFGFLIAVSAVILRFVPPVGHRPPGEGGLEHSSSTTLVFLLLFTVPILYKILSARAGQELFIRRIPGLAAIDEALGRATELGRPIMFNFGLVGLGIDALQAMTILAHVTKRVAKYGMRVLVPVVDPQVLAVTQGILKEAYAAEGREDLYHPDNVIYLSGDQMTFAAGVVGIMSRERVAANFMMGEFFAESLIIAETGQHIGAIQIAGTPSPLQIPFFVATCDYVIIGDEFYAGSAYLSREPTLLGSLIGQDWGKALITFIVASGLVLVSLPTTWTWAGEAVDFFSRQLGR